MPFLLGFSRFLVFGPLNVAPPLLVCLRGQIGPPRSICAAYRGLPGNIRRGRMFGMKRILIPFLLSAVVLAAEPRSPLNVSGRIGEILENGIILQDAEMHTERTIIQRGPRGFKTKPRTQTATQTVTTAPLAHGADVYVECPTNDLRQGEFWAGIIYRNGALRYEGTNRISRTVAAFAVEPEKRD